MIDDKPVRVPLNQFTEWSAAHQREYYDRLLADIVRQVQAIPMIDEETATRTIEDVRAMLAIDLERYIGEVAATVAGGMRGNDEALH